MTCPATVIAKSWGLLQRRQEAQAQRQSMPSRSVGGMKHAWFTAASPDEAIRGVSLHEGRVTVATSNTRWCSDGFEANCDDGDKRRD